MRKAISFDEFSDMCKQNEDGTCGLDCHQCGEFGCDFFNSLLSAFEGLPE